MSSVTRIKMLFVVQASAKETGHFAAPCLVLIKSNSKSKFAYYFISDIHMHVIFYQFMVKKDVLSSSRL